MRRNQPVTSQPMRLTHFPTICALLAHGQVMMFANGIGNVFECEFPATEIAEQIVAVSRDPDRDVLVPMKRYMTLYDWMRDATRGKRQMPVGKQFYAVSTPIILDLAMGTAR